MRQATASLSIALGMICLGYVMQVFPRRSDTFVITELLAQQRAGLDGRSSRCGLRPITAPMAQWLACWRR